MNIRAAEQFLRRDDKALRLRQSMDGPHLLIERKTFRGKIGAVGRLTKDSGRRAEEGHVLVATLPWGPLDGRVLRESLQAADSWRTPGWIDKIERRDRMAHLAKKRNRTDTLRYRSHELFDQYMWRSKSRISAFVGGKR